MSDPAIRTLVLIVLGFLVLGTAIGRILSRQVSSEGSVRIVKNLNARMNAWWVMVCIFVASLLIGSIATVVLFGITSFLAFREFVTLTPTKRADHRTLFWVFFVIIPIHYCLVGAAWYGMFSIFIPVYAFLLVPVRIALAGDHERYLERSSKIQWGLMVCVYFISHVPALLMLNIPGYQGRNASLLFFFVLIVQMNDVFQYATGTLFGKHKITPVISPNKTWEGFIGGLVLTAAVGMAVHWTTPFNTWQAACMALAIAAVGFCGDVTMSAVKRDLGVKDFSESLPGHGGVMDRLDSLSFAAPFFFHLTRYFFSG